MPGMRLQSGDEGMAGMKPSMSMSHDGKPEHSHPMTMLGMHGGPEVDMRSMNPSSRSQTLGRDCAKMAGGF